MSNATADIDEERLVWSKIVTELLLKGKDVRPIVLTLTLRRHPHHAIAKLGGVHHEPFEGGKIGIVAGLEGSVGNFGRILVVPVGEEARQLGVSWHHARKAGRGLDAFRSCLFPLQKERDIVLVFDAGLKAGDCERLSDVGSGKVVFVNFFDHVNGG